jgi:hypothetical protein
MRSFATTLNVPQRVRNFLGMTGKRRPRIGCKTWGRVLGILAVLIALANVAFVPSYP